MITAAAEEPDEILDRIESATNKQAIIRQLDSREVHAVLALAQENAQSSRHRAVEALQKELAVSRTRFYRFGCAC